MSPAFRRLLGAYAEAPTPAARAAVETRIRETYERPRAVVISDMSGFSRITREEGILHFLGLIHRMQTLCRPIVERHGGTWVKAEADNLYLSFATADEAMTAAIAMHEACDKDADGRRRNDTVSLSIGIDHGPVLDLDGEDFYGDPVNIASKLGEDLGDAGDLLVTRTAAGAFAPPAGWRSEVASARISSVDIEYLVLRRD
jgi:class 3 adenylate cyclase